MATATINEVRLESDDALDVTLSSGHVISIYGNGEMTIESFEAPWTEYSINLVSKVERAAKKERKQRKAAV